MPSPSESQATMRHSWRPPRRSTSFTVQRSRPARRAPPRAARATHPNAPPAERPAPGVGAAAQCARAGAVRSASPT
jgi:hypothetical protein